MGQVMLYRMDVLGGKGRKELVYMFGERFPDVAGVELEASVPGA